MKTKFLIVLLAIAPVIVQAQVNYQISGGAAYVVDSPNAVGNVVIPLTYSNYPVVGINDNAFEDCAGMTGVVIPNSVTNIGYAAFAGCESLASVLIPDSVVWIDEFAFWDCTTLTDIIIPSPGPGPADPTSRSGGVTEIGDYAFFGCTRLTNITVLGDPPLLGGSDAFYGDPATIYYFFGATGWGTSYDGLPAVELGGPESGGALVNYALSTPNIAYVSGSPYAFGSITIVSNFDAVPVTSVSLNSIIVGASSAFDGCHDLTSVTVPGTVTNIGYEAFSDCINLTNITFLGNAPALWDSHALSGVNPNAVVYFYVGTSGWGSTYGGVPTVELFAAPHIESNAVGTESGKFSLTVTGASEQTVVIEASSDLIHWKPIWTNTLCCLSTNFADAQWTNYPARFYRAR